MYDFKIGDRVIYIGSGSIMHGKRGVVVDMSHTEVGVDWDDFISGHNCTGRARSGHGYYVSKHSLQLAVITCNYEDC